MPSCAGWSGNPVLAVFWSWCRFSATLPPRQSWASSAAMMRARSRREPPLASLARWLRSVSRLRFMRSSEALSAAQVAILPPNSEKPQPARCARLRALAISSPCLMIAKSYFRIWPGLARPPVSILASSARSCRHSREAAVAWPTPAHDRAMAPSSTARIASLPAPPFICPPRRMQDAGAARRIQTGIAHGLANLTRLRLTVS